MSQQHRRNFQHKEKSSNDNLVTYEAKNGEKKFSQHAPTCKYARWDYLGKKEIDNLVIDKIGI